jgi:DNA-binding transcriptional MerR regulator
MEVVLMVKSDLPTIPDKLYFTIGEVANLCDLRPHVLRYWEQEFPQLSPSKRRGNRRYYQRKDVVLIRSIKDLLYSQGYTIEGARQQLTADESDSKGGGVIKAQKHHESVHKAVVGLQDIVRDLESE